MNKIRNVSLSYLKQIGDVNPYVILPGLVFLIGPSLLGIYDPVIYICATIFISVGLVWLISGNRLEFPVFIPKVSGILILIFAGLYLSSSIMAINKALAIQEVPKLLFGILMFFLASQIKSVPEFKILAKVIIIGAVICCVLSLGLINIEYLKKPS